MGLERLSPYEQGRLKDLLAKSIGMPPRNLPDRHVHLLMRVGDGMAWSREFQLEAGELARRIDAEMEMHSTRYNHSE